MIKKLRYRYYCEYCKKSGCNAASIKKHEERCTLNINRICGMCLLVEKAYHKENLLEAIELLKPYKDYRGIGVRAEFLPQDISNKLRNILNNCPVCILTALRLSNICVYAMKDFNYKTESESWLDDYNDSLEPEYY